jgi:hypothetical protein
LTGWVCRERGRCYELLVKTFGAPLGDSGEKEEGEEEWVQGLRLEGKIRKNQRPKEERCPVEEEAMVLEPAPLAR